MTTPTDEGRKTHERAIKLLDRLAHLKELSASDGGLFVSSHQPSGSDLVEAIAAKGFLAGEASILESEEVKALIEAVRLARGFQRLLGADADDDLVATLDKASANFQKLKDSVLGEK